MNTETHNPAAITGHELGATWCAADGTPITVAEKMADVFDRAAWTSHCAPVVEIAEGVVPAYDMNGHRCGERFARWSVRVSDLKCIVYDWDAGEAGALAWIDDMLRDCERPAHLAALADILAER